MTNPDSPMIQPLANAIARELDATVPVVYEPVSADEHELYEMIPETDMDSLVDEMASARLSEAIHNKDMATIKEMLGDDLTLRKMVNPAFQVLSDVERTMIKRVRLHAEEACRANLVDALHRQDQEMIDYTDQLLSMAW